MFIYRNFLTSIFLLKIFETLRIALKLWKLISKNAESFEQKRTCNRPFINFKVSFLFFFSLWCYDLNSWLLHGECMLLSSFFKDRKHNIDRENIVLNYDLMCHRGLFCMSCSAFCEFNWVGVFGGGGGGAGAGCSCNHCIPSN